MSVRRKRETTFENTVRKAIARGSDNVPVSYPPFHSTRNLFRNYLSWSEPLSYEEWMDLEDDKKAAALYVQFYSQITLAWNKVKSFYAVEEDGVETVIQYLLKNVPLIKEDKKRFNSKYIYRVASNCLYCICHDIKRDRDRWELEISNIQYGSDGSEEFDLFSTVVGDDESDFVDKMEVNELWRIVDSLGEEVAEVVEKILSGKSLRGQKTQDVIELLRTNLAQFKDLI